MMQNFEELTGSTPAKSTLADWLEHGIIIFPAVNITPELIPAGNASLAPTLHIAELDTGIVFIIIIRIYLFTTHV